MDGLSVLWGLGVDGLRRACGSRIGRARLALPGTPLAAARIGLVRHRRKQNHDDVNTKRLCEKSSGF